MFMSNDPTSNIFHYSILGSSFKYLNHTNQGFSKFYLHYRKFPIILFWDTYKLQSQLTYQMVRH